MIKENSLCLLCQRPLNYDLRLDDIFSFGRIEPPLFCSACQEHFRSKPVQSPACSACQRPLSTQGIDPYRQVHQYQGEIYGLDCLRWRKSYSLALIKNQPLLAYDDFVREWLYRYKYQGDVRLARAVAPLLKKTYPRYKNCLWLTLPSSPNTLARRKFHATHEILYQAGITFEEIFVYQGDGRRQAQKTRKERLQLGHVYRLQQDVIDLPDKPLLIFDDVYTTGTTLIRAKTALMAAYQMAGQPCPPIHSMTIAREQQTLNPE